MTPPNGSFYAVPDRRRRRVNRPFDAPRTTAAGRTRGLPSSSSSPPSPVRTRNAYCALAVLSGLHIPYPTMATGARTRKTTSSPELDPSNLNNVERLIFAQAVHEFGSNAWQEVSKLLSKHPSISQPKGTFTPQVRSYLFKPGGCESHAVLICCSHVLRSTST